MPERVIEAALFVIPFLGFIAWRFVLRASVPRTWLVVASAGVTALMLGALMWLYASDASDANRAYVPAELRRGRVIEGHAGAALPPRNLDGHDDPGGSD